MRTQQNRKPKSIHEALFLLKGRKIPQQQMYKKNGYEAERSSAINMIMLR